MVWDKEQPHYARNINEIRCYTSLHIGSTSHSCSACRVSMEQNWWSNWTDRGVPTGGIDSIWIPAWTHRVHTGCSQEGQGVETLRNSFPSCQRMWRWPYPGGPSPQNFVSPTESFRLGTCDQFSAPIKSTVLVGWNSFIAKKNNEQKFFVVFIRILILAVDGIPHSSFAFLTLESVTQLFMRLCVCRWPPSKFRSDFVRLFWTFSRTVYLMGTSILQNLRFKIGHMGRVRLWLRLNLW